MVNFFKGFIIGIGKIIPGVSGAMIAISMGIYDKALFYICNFRKNKKESIKFLFPIGCGIILSIIFFSKIISLALKSYYLLTMMFFIGLIIGGIPSVVKMVRKKDYVNTFISFSFFFLIAIMNIDNVYVLKYGIWDYVVYFLSGVVEAIGTIVPGISGTALLMIMGTYNTLLEAIGNLSNLMIIIPFILGLIAGIFSIIRLVNYLLREKESIFYSIVLGILLSSILLLLIQSFKYKPSLGSVLISFIFLALGILIGNFMEEK